MDCRQFRKLISFWVDGILDKQEQEQFIQHMENCEQCRIELDEYENMISLMHSLEEVELPQGFHDRLHTSLEEEIKQNGQLLTKDRKIKRMARWTGVVAAIFVLLFSIRLLDNVGFLGMEQAKDNIETKSKEGSNSAPELGMASISSNEESGSLSKEEDSRLKVQMQEDVEEDDTPDYNTSDRNILADSMENDDIEDNDISDDVSEDTLTDIEMDEENISVESESIDDEKTSSGIMQFAHTNASGKIETNLVKVKVQDVCITPATIKMMAINNGIEVVKSSEDSVILKLSNLEDRQILYKELSQVGEIEDSGEKTESMEVTIIITREE